MRSRSAALAVIALVLAAVATAIAAGHPVRPVPSTSLFYVKHGSFSITLDTNKTSRKIVAGPVFPHNNQRPESGVLAVCPGSSPISEIHVGFPGATLKLSKHHYGFSRSYTQKRAQIVVVGPDQTPTLTTAKVHVTATVAGKKLITGKVSITASTCSLPPSKYRATIFKPG